MLVVNERREETFVAFNCRETIDENISLLFNHNSIGTITGIAGSSLDVILKLMYDEVIGQCDWWVRVSRTCSVQCL